MKKLLLFLIALVLFAPELTFAVSYKVESAGSTNANQCYNADELELCGYQSYVGLTDTSVHLYSCSGDINNRYIGIPGVGNYYNKTDTDFTGTNWNVVEIGSAPTPVVTSYIYNDCSNDGESGGGSTTTDSYTPTSTPLTTHEQYLQYAIILFFVSFIGLCYMFPKLKNPN